MSQGPAFTDQEPRGQRATGQGPARQSHQHLELPMSFRPLGVETFDPTIRIIDRTGTVTATASGHRRVTRKDFTDRLGLPEDATNAQFMAALDARLASKPAAAPQASMEDALYARVTGQTAAPAPAPAPVNMSDDALWGRLFTKPAA